MVNSVVAWALHIARHYGVFCLVYLVRVFCCFGLVGVLFWIRFALVMMCCVGGFGGACALVADFVVLVVGYFVACDSWFALGCCFWFICILRISWGTLLFILFGLLFVCLLWVT